MALTSTTRRNDYIGSSSTSVYAYSFKVFLNTDLLVTVRNIASGAETTLVLTTDYTVSGVLESSGGNVTLVNSGQAWLSAGNLSADYALTIRRVRPLTQITDIRNQGDFFPESHENEFDRGVMVAQQQQDEIDRSVKLPETVLPSAFDPTLPALIAQPDVILMTNASGDGWTTGASSGSFDLTRMFGRGTRAELDALVAAAPTTSRYFYVTDEEIHYYYTGVAADPNGGYKVLG